MAETDDDKGDNTDANRGKEEATATAEPEAPAEDKPAGGLYLGDDPVDHVRDIQDILDQRFGA